MVIMMHLRVFVPWIWSILLYQTCYYYPIMVGGSGTTATTDVADDVDAAWSYFEQGNEVDIPSPPQQ